MPNTSLPPSKIATVGEDRPSGDRSKDLMYFLKAYAENNPAAAALWCFGVGFVLGWRLKPW